MSWALPAFDVPRPINLLLQDCTEYPGSNGANRLPSLAFVSVVLLHGPTMNQQERIVPPDFRTNEPRMSTSVAIAQSLERRERDRGKSVPDARRELARKLRAGIGTVDNLVRGRIKRVDDTIRDRLRALLMRELEAEIQRLTHELETLRRGGHHLASQHISEVEAHLEAARLILTGGAR
jgi:hypothetical protein